MGSTRKKRESTKRVNRNMLALVFLLLASSMFGAYQLYWQPKQKKEEARAALEKADRLLGQNRQQEAVDGYREATALDPSLAQAWNSLAVIEVSGQRMQEALPFFNQALDLDANFFEAQVGRAIAYEGLGRFLEAESDYKKSTIVAAQFWWGALQSRVSISTAGTIS